MLGGQIDPRFPDEAGELVETLGLSDYVRQYTDADDEMLQGLYAHAAVFAFPSLAEGFGIPILEAMAAGVPVVTSDAAAVQETADGGALTVSGTTADHWVQALDRVLSDADFAQNLRQRGRAVAARNTWATAAERTLAILADAASGATMGGERDA